MSIGKTEHRIGIWQREALADLPEGIGPFASDLPKHPAISDREGNASSPPLTPPSFEERLKALSEGHRIMSTNFLIESMQPILKHTFSLPDAQERTQVLSQIDNYLQSLHTLLKSPNLDSMAACLHQIHIKVPQAQKSALAPHLQQAQLANIIVIADCLAAATQKNTPMHDISQCVLKLANYFDPTAAPTDIHTPHELTAIYQLLHRCTDMARQHTADQLRSYQELLILTRYAALRSPKLWCPLLRSLAEHAPTQHLKDSTIRFARAQEMIRLAKQYKLEFVTRTALLLMAPGIFDQSQPPAQFSAKQHQQLLADLDTLEQFLSKPNDLQNQDAFKEMATRYQSSHSKLMKTIGIALILIGVKALLSGALLIASLYVPTIALQASLLLSRTIRIYIASITALCFGVGTLLVASGVYLFRSQGAGSDSSLDSLYEKRVAQVAVLEDDREDDAAPLLMRRARSETTRW